MSDIVKKVILRHSGSGVVDVTPSFADGTYFALDPDFDTGALSIFLGKSITYGVIFTGSEVTGTYTDTFIVSNTAGNDLVYHLTATVTDLLPNFYGDPAFDSTIDFGKVVPVGETITIGAGTTPISLPFYLDGLDTRTQSIYLQSEIVTAGNITSLSLYVYYAPTIELTNFTIRMKHTSLSAFSSGGWETGFTTVYSSNTTISSTGWVEFIFSVPFEYNGTDNLMIDFSFDNIGYGDNGSTYSTATSGLALLYGYSSGALGDPTTWVGASPSSLTNASHMNLKINIQESVISSTTEITITNDTKNSIEIMIPTFTTGTYFALDTDFATGEITLASGESVIYGVYFIGSNILNETYTDILTLKNGYGDDITYHLTANTIPVPILSSSPSAGGTISFNVEQGGLDSSAITLANIGDLGSTINLTGATFSGVDLALFDLDVPFVNPTPLDGPTGSHTYTVDFLGSMGIGLHSAALTFSNDFAGDIVYNLEANVVVSPDMFADARILTGTLPIVAYSNNSLATAEAGEPQHVWDGGGTYYGPSKSVWFKWTPSENLNVKIITTGTAFYIGMGIYTGVAVNALTPVSLGVYGYGSSYILVSVTGGVDYYIAIDGYPGWSGAISLTVDLFPDNFADAQLLTGALPILKTANNTGATTEASEPDHSFISLSFYPSYYSLWYKWVSTVTGNVKISMISPDQSYPSAAMYTDATMPPPYSRSTQIGVVSTSSGTGTTYNSGSIPVISGNTYYIAAGFYGYYVGTFTLTISSV